MKKSYVLSFIGVIVNLTISLSQPLQKPLGEIRSTKANDLTAPFIGISVAIPMPGFLKGKNQKRFTEPDRNSAVNRIEERREKLYGEPGILPLKRKSGVPSQGKLVSFATGDIPQNWNINNLFSSMNDRPSPDGPHTNDFAETCAYYACYYECQGCGLDYSDGYNNAYAHNEGHNYECEQVVFVNGHTYTLNDYSVDYSQCTPPDNPGNPPTGGGSGMSNGAANPGQYPIVRFDDRCQFSSDMWNRSVGSDSEYFGVITTSGEYLVTQQQGATGGQVNGLYNYNGQAYYYYAANGATSSPFLGAVQSGQYFFIPIQATVHTHTPCVHDGTDGVSQPVSSDDTNLANVYPSITNYVIGCNGTVAEFNGTNPNYYNRSSCTTMH